GFSRQRFPRNGAALSVTAQCVRIKWPQVLPKLSPGRPSSAMHCCAPPPARAACWSAWRSRELCRPRIRTSRWHGCAAYGAELAASVPLGVAADVLAPGALMVGGALISALALVLFALAATLPLWFSSRVL